MQEFLSWLTAISGSDDPLGDVIVDHDIRLTALEKELSLLRSEIQSVSNAKALKG